MARTQSFCPPAFHVEALSLTEMVFGEINETKKAREAILMSDKYSICKVYYHDEREYVVSMRGAVHQEERSLLIYTC